MGMQSSFDNARELRRYQTEAERRLWEALRRHKVAGQRFQRQVVIEPFIVDFCCKRAKLIIEVDGEHHHEQKVYDDERTAFLEEKGFRVLRFWNREVMNDLGAVVREIERVVEEISSR
jgi:very-short-patch-repair endonuclease